MVDPDDEAQAFEAFCNFDIKCAKSAIYPNKLLILRKFYLPSTSLSLGWVILIDDAVGRVDENHAPDAALFRVCRGKNWSNWPVFLELYCSGVIVPLVCLLEYGRLCSIAQRQLHWGHEYAVFGRFEPDRIYCDVLLKLIILYLRGPFKVYLIVVDLISP